MKEPLKSQEFGRRGRIEPPEKKQKEPQFDKGKLAEYERAAKKDPDFAERVRRWQQISEFQRAGSGTLDDVREKERLEKLIAERYAHPPERRPRVQE